jgi:predicted nucleic acid-binding protein
LFLDTNTYLGFFRLSDDNIEQVRKLSDRVDTGETTLYVTRQVRSEYLRNRESAIDEALDTVRKAPKLPDRFAHLYESIRGYDEVRAALRDADQRLQRLKDDAVTAVEEGSLHADALIEELFLRGQTVELTDQILQAAQLRTFLGNPPGKAGSIGDAVNWESLLVTVPDGADLVLVTNDSDFKSKLDPNRLHQFLAAEWAGRKRSSVKLHATLRSALETHYPDIQLIPERDPEQELAIDELANAGSFAETHLAIRRLSRFAEFDTEQVTALANAAEDNSQIRGIMQDDDVFEFYDNLLRQYGPTMESHLFDRLAERLEDAAAMRSRLN